MERRPRSLVLSAGTQRTLQFLVGLGLVIYEAVIREGETRWPFLVFYAGMMGMPLAERADEMRQSSAARRRSHDPAAGEDSIL